VPHPNAVEPSTGMTRRLTSQDVTPARSAPPPGRPRLPDADRPAARGHVGRPHEVTPQAGPEVDFTRRTGLSCRRHKTERPANLAGQAALMVGREFHRDGGTEPTRSDQTDIRRRPAGSVSETPSQACCRGEFVDQTRHTTTDITRTITVGVHATDILTRAGLSHCLARCPKLVEVDPGTSQEPEVFVVGVEDASASATEVLKNLSPAGTGRFVLVVDKWQDAIVSTLVELGVRAILLRTRVSSAEFTRTVIAVAEGEGVLPLSLQGSLMREVQVLHREVLAPRGLTSSGFSPREIDVLRLLSEGMDLEGVAEKMSYSERTVKNILYGAMKRHQLRNRTHAVSHAIRSGLI
jgi:DNA-binding NarL/FixJ family response regulator